MLLRLFAKNFWRSTICGFAIFFVISFFGCNPKNSKTEPAQEQASMGNAGAGSTTSILSSGEKRAFFSWLYKEMHEQIFLHKEENAKDLAAWINVLNQGGSIEGVYHGLVLSGRYAELERGSVSLPAIRLLAEEMAWLRIPDDSKKIESERGKVAQKIAQENMGLSLFSVKRIFGEYLLQEIDKRKADRSSLANWYAAIVVRWAAKDVDFGMPQRNKPDFELHKNWAMTNSIGLIQWELLNRVHRLFNYYGGVMGTRSIPGVHSK